MRVGLIQLLIFLLPSIGPALAYEEDFIEEVTRAVIDYKDGMAQGIEAIEMIITDTLPHACVSDKDKLKFKKYLEQRKGCGDQEILEHLAPILELNNDSSDVITHAAREKSDLDQWAWIRQGLKSEVERLSCEQNLMGLENDQDLEKGFLALVKAKDQLRRLEKEFYTEFLANPHARQLILKSQVSSSCLHPAGKHAKAFLYRECPDTGGMGLVTSKYDDGLDRVDEFLSQVMTGGYDDGAVCRVSMRQGRYIGGQRQQKFPFGTRTDKWGRESSASLLNKCMTERLLNGDLNGLYQKMKQAGGYLNPTLENKVAAYQKIKALEQQLFDSSPLLNSDQIKVAAGLAAYLKGDPAGHPEKFRKALKLAKEARQESLKQLVEKYQVAIAAKTKDAVEDNLENYELLQAVEPFIKKGRDSRHRWERDISCQVRRRLDRQGGLEKIKKDVSDMLVVALPLGTGAVAKGLLVAGAGLKATRVAGVLGSSSRIGVATESRALLASAMATEGGALSLDLTFIRDKINQCRNFMTSFFDNPKMCSPQRPDRKELESRYKECQQLLRDALQSTALAALGGVAVIGAQTKRLLSIKASPAVQTKGELGDFEALKNSLSNNKRKAMRRKYFSKKSYQSLDEKDQVYFAALSDLLEKKWRKEGLSEAAIKRKVKQNMDEVMGRCNKVKK